MTPSVLRGIRTRLNLSQADCAAALGVAVETFRTWDAGRRTAPAAVVRRAEALTVKRPAHQRLPLQVLANELHVHVRTLRAAAHDGRLAAVTARFGLATSWTVESAILAVAALAAFRLGVDVLWVVLGGALLSLLAVR